MKDNSRELFNVYKDDFEFCKEIIKNNSTSFYIAFSKLPKYEAMSVFAIYAFCRQADDITDKHDNIEELNKLEEKLIDLENGIIVNDPVFKALDVVFKNFSMSFKPFFEMIKGQRQDFNFMQPNSQKQLEDYCYYVAGTVGLMLLPIISKDSNQSKELAKKIGIAMQITNILRDIGEDLSNDRVYIPSDLIKQFNVSLDNREVNKNFISLWEYEAKIAEDNYNEGIKLIDYLIKEAKEPLMIAINLYHEILNVVRKNNYQVFDNRNYVGKIKKASLIRKSLNDLKDNQ
ncbi:squalene/phytoene synthase family protein [Lactobacillus sp. S2-2]|uniref:phytoene/squalene synthase family protein n=1 Tax=Lactobacillus sp. S2-2 TaxID=2692917 RepID=UPI001F15BC68|nr:phytoene/squalene synthase family protein [Lactobacillus sp. S2-2]MCF6515010.1 squalene/phytoene synthase family protein [Lactobacillus sp. S2-2]